MLLLQNHWMCTAGVVSTSTWIGICPSCRSGVQPPHAPLHSPIATLKTRGVACLQGSIRAECGPGSFGSGERQMKMIPIITQGSRVLKGKEAVLKGKEAVRDVLSFLYRG